MEQPQNKIYNAFKEAGLETQARQLSIKSNEKVVPAVGHYIAIADCMNAESYLKTKKESPFVVACAASYYPKKYQLLEESIWKIKNYVIDLCATEKNPEKLEKAKELKAKLINEILEIP